MIKHPKTKKELQQEALRNALRENLLKRRQQRLDRLSQTTQSKEFQKES